jgi:hypothetical protein
MPTRARLPVRCVGKIAPGAAASERAVRDFAHPTLVPQKSKSA